jgi:UDP-N-acetylglucosamine acyltransferase
MSRAQEERGAGFRQWQGAWVHETARLADDVQLAPGAVVGAEVSVGRGTSVGHHAVLLGPMVLGEDNRVHAGAVLGGDPQDVGFQGQPVRLEIGSRNVFREGVTISRGSHKGSGVTRIGNDNYFMAGSHVGHDSIVEDRCVFANGVLIAGHCHVHANANFSGGSAIVQFTSVGRFVFLGGLAGARSDLEPFIVHDLTSTTSGTMGRPIAINQVGLRRGGISEEAILKLKTAFKVLFIRGELDLAEARREIERRDALSSEVDELLEFIQRKRSGRFGRYLERPKA